MVGDRGYVAGAQPVAEVRWGGVRRVLRAREAALARAFLDAIRDRPLGEIRLHFTEARVTASLSVPVRAAPGPRGRSSGRRAAAGASGLGE